MAMEPKTPILVVHRDVNTARGLAELLVARYDVYVTKVPQRALDFLEEKRVDALIVSEHINGMTALQWLPEIAERHPALIRILLTSELCGKEIDAARENGLIHTCISEPIVATEFREIIDSFFLPPAEDEQEEEIVLDEVVVQDDEAPEPLGEASPIEEDGPAGTPQPGERTSLVREERLNPEGDSAAGDDRPGDPGEPAENRISLEPEANQVPPSQESASPPAASPASGPMERESPVDLEDEYRDLTLAETLSTHRQKLQAKQENLNREIEKLKTEIDVLETSRSNLTSQFMQLQAEVNRLEEDTMNIVERKRRLEEKRAEMERQVQEYEKGLTQLVEKKVELEAHCSALKEIQETMKVGVDPKAIRASIHPSEIYNKASQWAVLWRKAEAKAERLELHIKKQEAELRRLHEEVTGVRKRKELSEKAYHEELRQYREQLATLRRRASEFEQRYNLVVQQNLELMDRIQWLQAIAERVSDDMH